VVTILVCSSHLHTGLRVLAEALGIPCALSSPRDVVLASLGRAAAAGMRRRILLAV